MGKQHNLPETNHPLLSKQTQNNMKNRKHTLALLAAAAALLAGSPLQAQTNGDRSSDIAVYYNMGYGSLPYSGAANWTDKPIVAFGAGADYTYWLNPHFGLGAGLRFTYLSSRQTSDALVQSFSAQMPVAGFGTTAVTLRGTASAIEEERVASFLELPLKAYYQLDCGLFGSLGLSLSKAISNQVVGHGCESPAFAVTDIPALGIALPTPVPSGITAEEVHTSNTAANFKPFFCLLNAEVGYRYAYDGTNAVSFSLFGRYALGKNKVETVDGLFSYANGQVLVNRSATSLVDKVGYYEFGAKVAIHFGLSCK